jgi:hypothetical protein
MYDEKTSLYQEWQLLTYYALVPNMQCIYSPDEYFNPLTITEV